MEISSRNTAVFSDVIASIASEAASTIEGIAVLRNHEKSKMFTRGGGVSVYFLPNDRVSIDIYVNIGHGYNVPPTVAEVQEKVKLEVEGATKFRVHSVNVQIVSVIFPQ